MISIFAFFFRGLNLLSGWQNAPLNIIDVLEKLIILLDAAIHNSSSNCEKAASQSVIPLLLKILPKLEEQVSHYYLTYFRKI